MRLLRAQVCSLALLLTVSACGSDPGEPDPVDLSFDAPQAPPTVLRPTLRLGDATVRIADPKLPGFEEWALFFDGENLASADSCVVKIERGGDLIRELEGTLTATSCAATWDGLAEGGDYVDPGMVDARAELLIGTRAVANAATTLAVARVGVRQIQLQALTRRARQPLLYRAMDGVRFGYYEVEANRPPWRIAPDFAERSSASFLDLADGTPRDLPEIWTDVDSPPLDDTSPDGAERDSYNLPTAWAAGSEMSIVATFSTEAANGATFVEDNVELRVVPPEGTNADGSLEVTNAGTVTLVTNGSLVPNVGRYDVALDWRFEARLEGGEWMELPGSVTTTHRFYGTAAAPRFDYSDSLHVPWVDVVDQVAQWVDGETSDPDEVGSMIVEGVYFELGLRYDRERGASFYTSYPGRTWEGANFDLTRFQERVNGDVINCSDAASIVSTYANMVGLDFRYHILQHRTERGFDLNYLRAIGGAEFAFAPFTSGRNAFSYHAVTGPADGDFFDATLALDGDDDPSSAPHELWLVQEIPPMDYLNALSPEGSQIGVRVDEQVRIR